MLNQLPPEETIFFKIGFENAKCRDLGSSIKKVVRSHFILKKLNLKNKQNLNVLLFI